MADFRITGDPTSIGCAGAILGDHVENIATGDVYVKTGTGATAFTLAASAYGGGGVVAGALSIEEVDASPSYANITTVRFDQADGFVVTNPTAGVARVDLTGIPQANVASLVTDLADKASVASLVAGLAAKVNLAGLAGGQTVRGGTAASENLTLTSTAHATKGYVAITNPLAVNGATLVGAEGFHAETSTGGATFESTQTSASEQLCQLRVKAYRASSPASGINLRLNAFGEGWYEALGGISDRAGSCSVRTFQGAGGLALVSGNTATTATMRFMVGGETTTAKLWLEIDTLGNFVIGNAALATTATDGFPFIPSCAGVPTGVPAGSYTGRIPLVYDTTNDRLYAYNGGWKLMQAV